MERQVEKMNAGAHLAVTFAILLLVGFFLSIVRLVFFASS